MQTEEKRTVFDIAEAIARSRKAVQESIDFRRRNVQRKDALVQKPTSSPQSRAEPSFAPVDTLLTDLNMKLQNEAYLRSTYEQAVSHLRGRVQELESQNNQREEYSSEISVLKKELHQEQLWKLRFSDLEQDLTSRISAQTTRINVLEQEIQTKTRQISNLSQNGVSRDQLIDENRLLLAEIQAMNQRCAEALRKRAQIHKNLIQESRDSQESASPDDPKTDENSNIEISPIVAGLEKGQVSPEKESEENAQIQESENRIEELEHRLQISTMRYEELKRRMSPSVPEIPMSQKKAKTVADSSSEPRSVQHRPPKHKKKARLLASPKPSTLAGKGKKPGFS